LNSACSCGESCLSKRAESCSVVRCRSSCCATQKLRTLLCFIHAGCHPAIRFYESLSVDKR
jgi:hypothetical protein